MTKKNKKTNTLNLKTTEYLKSEKLITGITNTLFNELKKPTKKTNKTLSNKENTNKKTYKNPWLLVSVFNNKSIRKNLKKNNPLNIVFIDIIRQKCKPFIMFIKNNKSFLKEKKPIKTNKNQSRSGENRDRQLIENLPVLT